MKRLFLLFTPILFSLSTAGQKYSYVPSDSHEIIYEEGDALAVSELSNTSVLIRAKRIKKKVIALYLIVTNDYDRLNFIPTEIEVVSVDNENNQVYQVIVEPEEYIWKLKRKQDWTRGFLAYSQTVEEQKAGYSESSTQTKETGSIYSETTSRPFRTDYSTTSKYVSNSQSTTTTYDQSKVSEVSARNRQEMRERVQADQIRLQDLDQALLKSQTLKKGETYSGYVIVKVTGLADVIKVKLKLQDDVHEFFFIKP